MKKPPVSGLASFSCKKVWRHLRTGDAVLVNRQPTLHKPGIMAHHARVLRHERVIRMHCAPRPLAPLGWPPPCHYAMRACGLPACGVRQTPTATRTTPTLTAMR